MYRRRDNWTAGAGFDYTRLLSTSDYEEFYMATAQVLVGGAVDPAVLPRSTLAGGL